MTKFTEDRSKQQILTLARPIKEDMRKGLIGRGDRDPCSKGSSRERVKGRGSLEPREGSPPRGGASGLKGKQLEWRGKGRASLPLKASPVCSFSSR